MVKKLTEKNIVTSRPPVIAIMGHIDHGKSTLLDFIRKSNVADMEAGGITQHVGSYEVIQKTPEGKESKITFLDTPGHEAFCGIRSRVASIADIAILVVSAEEGVKPQTIEALKCIKETGIPYLVAISKIDSGKADLERTKQSLAEHEIYVEGYGGQIPWVAVSGKTGEGVPELLDMLVLLGELAELKGKYDLPAEGIVVEAHLDTREGITTIVIIKNGTLKKGQVVVSGNSLAVIRNMKSFAGKKLDEATFSSPITIIGWDNLPRVGATFVSFEKKSEAQEYIKSKVHTQVKNSTENNVDKNKVSVNLLVKADVSGSLEAVLNEIKKIKNETVYIKIVHADVGEISLNDIKKVEDLPQALILGFNTKIDSQAKSLAEKLSMEIHVETIIYKLMEWLKTEIEAKIPKINIEETQGKAKILKVFSKNKDKQIVGGRVELGSICLGEEVKILRRDAEIGKGKIKELQQQKAKTSEVKKDTEFGAEIQCTIEIVPGDRIEGFKIVAK